MKRGMYFATPPFHCKGGLQHGTIETGWVFKLGANTRYQQLNTIISVTGGDVITIMNDNYFTGL